MTQHDKEELKRRVREFSDKVTFAVFGQHEPPLKPAKIYKLAEDLMTDLLAAIEPTSTSAAVDEGGRTYPELLSEREKGELLEKAEHLWRDLQKNNLGGFSGINRPFFILNAFKEVIEQYGNRDIGLTWSQDDLNKVNTPGEKI